MVGSSSDVPGWRPTIFIGSSGKSVNRGIVNTLAAELVDRFELHLWRNVFPPGAYILDVLQKELRTVDAAILIFGADDEVARGERDFISSRDNVILEYGFFVAGLGRDRVCVLLEEGVTLPTDLVGLTVEQFDGSNDIKLGVTLEGCARRIKERWESLRRNKLSTSIPNDSVGALFGYSKTIEREQNRLDKLVSSLGESVASITDVYDEPVYFDSPDSALSSYAEALALVKRRFWTTTFLSSGFWSRPQPSVLTANAQMMVRLSRNGGEARRLFILDQDVEAVVQAFRADRIHLRELARGRELRESANRFEHVKRNIRAMIAAGFEVRVVFDAWSLHRALPPGLIDDPYDNELAIYDEFRVDSFQGGSMGSIRGVKSHCATTREFASYLAATETYFDDLWQEAQPVDSFLQLMQNSIRSADTRIDYTGNWLTAYEFDLDGEDERLKTLEARRAVAAIESIGRWGNLRSHLDVGTCTGRYIALFRDATVPSGELIGIDDDPDCVRFAQASLERRFPGDERIRIEHVDFSSDRLPRGDFDLVTCMLGTLSHFGWDRKLSRNDNLQSIIQRMREILADDGVLLLGTWSQFARDQRRLLGIYQDSDRERLARWTPPVDELHDRLRQARFEIELFEKPEARLDLTVCRPV